MKTAVRKVSTRADWTASLWGERRVVARVEMWADALVGEMDDSWVSDMAVSMAFSMAGP